MNASEITSKVWNYTHVLRDDGVSHGDYVKQITYLIFLKMAGEREQGSQQVKAPNLALSMRQFGFFKVRYRGLDKNTHRLFVAYALSNLLMAKNRLLRRKRLKLQVSCA